MRKFLRLLLVVGCLTVFTLPIPPSCEQINQVRTGDNMKG